MSVRVRIPVVLRRFAGGQAELTVEAESLRALFEELKARYPELVQRVLDAESGEIRSFVNVYVNDEDVRFLQGLDTPLQPGDTVSLIPAIAGGTF